MGIHLFSSDRYEEQRPLVASDQRPFGNPDPSNYIIIDEWSCGSPTGEYYLVLMIQYPDCTNYEGKKILVYHNVTKTSLLTQRLIDPHFSDKPGYYSPIARFLPNDEGWSMAIKMCRIILHN